MLIKSKISTWATKSTFHAIPNIFSTDKIPVKILWTICLLFSSGYCAFLVIGNLVTYFKFEIITVLEVVGDTDSQFPTVTICNLNPCGYETIDEFYFNTTLGQIIENNQEFNQYIPRYLTLNETSPNVTKEGKPIGDYLNSCRFNNAQCDEKDFKKFKMNNFKICYQFNGNKNNVKQSKRFGKQNGLRLELITDDPSDCRPPLDTLQNIVIYIQNYTNWITDDLTGVVINHGQETDIAIEKTVLTKRPKPYSNCVQNRKDPWSEMVKKTYEISNSYNQQYCMQICLQEYLIDKLDCYDEFLPFYKNTTRQMCESDVSGHKEDFYKNFNDKKCLLQCPIECEHYTFKQTLSTIKYPSEYYEKVLDYKMGLEGRNKIGKRLISLNFYYKSDLVTKIREDVSLEFADLISNIGGTLGLFLGMSLLSLVEFIELGVEIIEAKMESRKDSKVINVQPRN